MLPLHRFLAFVIPAALAVAQVPPAFDWQLDQALPSRRNVALAYHAGAGELVLFGGESFEVYGDTWRFGAAWRRAETDVAPSPRMNASMVYDSLRGRVVMFGGRTHTATLGDTWAFDGATWTQLAPVASPPARYGAAAAYDSVRDRVVLHGGWPSPTSGPADELWEFDGTTWTLRPQAGGTPSLFVGTLLFDPVRAVTLQLGAGLLGWDGAAWQSLSTAGLPQPLPFGPLVFDADAQRVLLVNPQQGTSSNPRSTAIFAWQGGDWTQVAAATLPTTHFVHMWWDAARHRVAGLEPTSIAQWNFRTWVLEQGAWQVATTPPPPPRRDTAIVYDTARRRMVVHGGRVNGGAEFDTWELADRTWWVGAFGVAGFLSREYHALVFDEARAVTVMYGGLDFGQHTLLTWDGSGSWIVPANSGNGPAARRTPAMAYDSLRERVVVFGGETMAGDVADLWAWNGAAWTDITPASGPSARREARLSYDRDRDRLVLFGGSNAATPLGDTWEHDGTQWSQRSPAAAPAPRSRHVQAYDQHRRVTVLFGGQGALGLRDTWTWDGTVWTEQSTDHAPDVGAGVAGAYDPDRRELVVFGGATARGEVWRLRDVGLGRWTELGHGCDAGGAGVLSLAAEAPLAIGASTTLRLANAPASFVALPLAWVGFQDETWFGVPLPLSLAVLGAPGCFVWSDALVQLPMLALGNGEATATLAIASQPAAVGLELFVQAGVWDFATARVGTANALAARIGVR